MPTLTVQQYASTEDLYIEIPKELDWKEGDTLCWQIDTQGYVVIHNTTKPKKEYPETYYDSQSEGIDFDQTYNDYIEETAKETFGQYYHSPEAQGGWYAVKEEAIKRYS